MVWQTVTERSSTNTWLAAVKRYAILAYGSFGHMSDVGLMVLGSLLVGLSIAVLLEGFELIDVISGDMSTGATLISAIVLAVVGLFCLGVASEGPLGRGRRLVGFEFWEVGVGRIIAAFVAGLIGLVVYNLLKSLLEGVPVPVAQGVEGIRAVSVAGMTVVPLLGVPASVLARESPWSWTRYAEMPVLFVVWVIAAMIVLV